MSTIQAEILLAALILARATALLFSKIALQTTDAFNILGIRFVLSFLLLFLLFRKKFRGLGKKTLGKGVTVGLAFSLLMALEMQALTLVDTSTASFLENTAIVIIPLCEAALRKKLPGKVTILTACVALLGVGLLTIGKKGNLILSKGEVICILAAFSYAAAIILTDRCAKGEDPILIGVIEIGTIGAVGWILSFLFEHPTIPTDGRTWGSILYLILVCTGFGYTLQPMAQRYVNAERVGLFCALNPAFASFLGVVFLHEKMGTMGFMGAALVLGSILLSKLGASYSQARLVRHKVGGS